MMAFDTSNLWRPTKTKIDIFTGSISELDGASLTGWTAWTRPKNATWFSLLCIGGGGGGGPGMSGAIGTIRGGGGGGGSGGFARLIVPAMMLPRTLFLYPGYGGVRGIFGVNAGNAYDGGTSVISMRPGLQFSGGITNALRASCILISGNSFATGGLPGDAVGGGNAGGGENIATNTTGPLTSLGPWFASEGASGGRGGDSGAPGSNSAAFGGAATGAIPLTGGAGGGSVSIADVASNGGDVPGGGRVPTKVGGVAGGAVGDNGAQGFFSNQPRLMTGGAGGGGGTTTGGRGGDGAPGCGGGGGGGGATGGDGGNGGPGMIVIVSW